jgi:hypothetical protein
MRNPLILIRQCFPQIRSPKDLTSVYPIAGPLPRTGNRMWWARLAGLSSALMCVALTVSCVSASRRDGAVDYNHMPGYNYDEAKIPPYTMLDPLQMADGAPVTTSQQWWSQRRPEIVSLFERNIYGRVPEAAENTGTRVVVVEPPTEALGGAARREQVDLIFRSTASADSSTRRLRVLLYVPARATGPVPVVFGLNGGGNQSVVDDPGIRPTEVWTTDGHAQVVGEPASATRGSESSRWQVSTVLSRGYGLATAYYQDVEVDAPSQRAKGVRPLFDSGQTRAAADSWGALAVWAWAYRQAVAYLRTNPAVDPTRVAVTGHSRRGKAADWAAATDSGIAALLSTESGKGGQSIQRRELGETVKHLEDAFGYWFCPAFAQWVGHDQQIPADGNLLLSLMAPRPVYVASAQDDHWADPKGEFLSARSAATVYTLLGAHALSPDNVMPPVDTPVGLDGSVAYHMRAGKHDVTAFDWDHYLDFLDARWGRPPAR